MSNISIKILTFIIFFFFLRLLLLNNLLILFWININVAYGDIWYSRSFETCLIRFRFIYLKLNLSVWINWFNLIIYFVRVIFFQLDFGVYFNISIININFIVLIVQLSISCELCKIEIYWCTIWSTWHHWINLNDCYGLVLVFLVYFFLIFVFVEAWCVFYLTAIIIFVSLFCFWFILIFPYLFRLVFIHPLSFFQNLKFKNII